ncbi:MAG: helix-turn-helix transcriptional regulator [Gemmatimonadota bacterium]
MCNAGNLLGKDVKLDRERTVERLLPLRPVEFHILLSLAAGERHGYGIIRDAEKRIGTRVPDVGTMYRALRRMEDRGLIGPLDRRPAPDVDDDRRNYYQITPRGLEVARAEARRLESLLHEARIGGLLEERTA